MTCWRENVIGEPLTRGPTFGAMPQSSAQMTIGLEQIFSGTVSLFVVGDL